MRPENCSDYTKKVTHNAIRRCERGPMFPECEENRGEGDLQNTDQHVSTSDDSDEDSCVVVSENCGPALRSGENKMENKVVPDRLWRSDVRPDMQPVQPTVRRSTRSTKGIHSNIYKEPRSAVIRSIGTRNYSNVILLVFLCFYIFLGIFLVFLLV